MVSGELKDQPVFNSVCIYETDFFCYKKSDPKKQETLRGIFNTIKLFWTPVPDHLKQNKTNKKNMYFQNPASMTFGDLAGKKITMEYEAVK